MKNRNQTKRVWFSQRMTVLWFALVTVLVGSGIPGLVSTAQAQVTAAWNQDADGNWSTGSNWIAGNAPTGTTGIAYFTNAITASRTVTVDASPWTIGGLTFGNTGAYGFTVSGGTVNLGGTTPTITVNSSSTGIVSSVLSGTAGLIKVGAGTLTLSGGNTYSGGTTISNGTLSIASSGALNGTTLVNPISGGTLSISGMVTITNGVFAAGCGTAGTGTMNIESGAVVTVANGANASRAYVGGKLDNTGTAGLGVLNLNGGILSISAGGTGAAGDAYCFWLNPYANGGASTLNLNGGVLKTARQIGDGGNGASILNFNGGTLQLAASISLIVNPTIGANNVRNGGAIIDTQGYTVTQAHAMIHSPVGGDNAIDGGLTKLGTGLLTLSAANTYTGPTTVSNGVLAVTTTSALPGYATAGKVTLSRGAGLSVGVGSWSTSAINTLINTGVYGSDTIFGFDTTAGSYVYDGTSFTLPTVAGIVKTGPNTLTITGGNTSTGGVSVLGGILRADFGVSIPATANVLLNNASLSTVASNSIIASLGTGAGQITVTPGTAVGFSAINTPLTVNLGGAGEPLSWGSSTFNPSVFVLNDTVANTNLTLQNAIALNSATRTINVNAAVVEISGVISNGSGTAGLIKDGAGKLILSNANTYSGGTTLNAGSLFLSGGDNRLSTSGAITVNSGTLDLGGSTQTTAGAVVFVSGLLTNGVLSKSGIAYDIRSGTVSAMLTGAVGLTKTTAGTLILANTNTYTGTTTVSAGALHITGGYSGSGNLVVNGGSLTLNMGDGVASFNGDGYGSSPLIGDGNNVGTLTLTSGTINVNTNSASSSIRLGCNGGSANGTINVNGGTMNVPGRILMGANSAGAQATLTLGGGVLNLGKAGSYTTATDPSCGVLWFGAFKSTVNLNSGTLALFGIRNTATATAGSAFNFNGGTLKAVANNNTDFLNLPSAIPAVVKSGGARIDTAGFDISVGPSLLHDASLGALADGGLTKLGAGVLTLKGAGSYNGTTVISNGTLRLGVANAITNSGAVVIAGGVYDLNGFTVTNSTVTLSSGSIINGSLNAASYTLADSGVIFANISGGTIVKSGTGNAVLYGANAYTGETSVAQGTLTLGRIDGPAYRLRLDASVIASLATNANGTGAVTESGQPVGYWGDLSGNNKSATQATQAYRPLFTNNVAEFNGRSALLFDGSDDDLTSLLDINATNIANMTIMIVYRQVTYKMNGGLWGHDDMGWDRLQLLNFGSTNANNIAGTNNSILVKGMNTNAVLLYTAVLKNGVANGSYVYINGVSDASTGLPAFTSWEGTGAASLTLGKIGPGATYNPGHIQIGEVLVYDTALSDTARRNVETYLRNKWLGASDPIPASITTNGPIQVATGAVLNLNGGWTAVTSVSGGGTISNGTLTVSGTLAPGGTNVIGTLSFATSPVLQGATLLADLAQNGSCDRLAVTSNLSLTGLTLQIADTEQLNWHKSYTLVTCSGALTGDLTASLPKNWKIYYDRTAGAGTVTLVYIPPGSIIRFM